MPKKDPLTKEFIKFCKQQGIKFVDIKTGKEISVEDNK